MLKKLFPFLAASFIIAGSALMVSAQLTHSVCPHGSQSKYYPTKSELLHLFITQLFS